MTESLAKLFLDCWPKPHFPPDCSVSGHLDYVAGEIDDLQPVIDAVTESGGRPKLVERIRTEHPIGRTHHQQHDDGLWDALSEALAFTWATKQAELSTVEFLYETGLPDLWVPGRALIEVKTVHESEEERSYRIAAVKKDGFLVRSGWQRPPGEMPVKKFQDHFDKAQEQFRRATESGKIGQPIAWFRFEGVDFGTSRRLVRSAVVDWATGTIARGGCDIVIYEGWSLETPLFSSVDLG